MTGSPVAIGPFTGGLNINEEAQFIADNELAECINFDIGRSGELTTRAGLKPLIREIGTPLKGLHLIGSIVLPSGTSRLYAAQSNSDGSYNYYYSDKPEDTTVAWTSMGTYAESRAIVTGVYDGVSTDPFVWFIPFNRIGTSPGTGFTQNLATNEITLVAAVPRGSSAVVYKNRLFVFGRVQVTGTGSYRVYYSAVGNFTSWPVNNFFDVNPGDGDHVSAAAVQGDAIVIFKRNSTWSLFFDTDPFLGTLRQINNAIGIPGANAVVPYENELYLISQRGIYRMVNLLFEEIGQNLSIQKLRLVHIGSDDRIAVIGNKIICRIHISFLPNTYRYFVYHTQADAWSEYKFQIVPDKFVHYLDFQQAYHQFVNDTSQPILYHMHPMATAESNYGDGSLGTTYLSLATKRFTYGALSGFKRLFWWALEIKGNNRPFEMLTVHDEILTSPVGHSTPSGVFSLVKSKIRTPFRSVQYVLRSNLTTGYLTVRSGEAMIRLKRDVSDDHPNT